MSQFNDQPDSDRNSKLRESIGSIAREAYPYFFIAQTHRSVDMKGSKDGGNRVRMPWLRLIRPLRHFYPAVFFVEIQSLLLPFFTRQIGEEVAHQGLFGFVPAQIVLRTLDHQLQTYQWVPECLLQGL